MNDTGVAGQESKSSKYHALAGLAGLAGGMLTQVSDNRNIMPPR